MLVSDVLVQTRGHLAVIEAGASVIDAAALLSKPQTDLVFVCDKGVLTGVVTKSDIVILVGRNVDAALDSAVDTIMKRDVAYCRATDALPDVWQVMKERQLQRLPVVNDRHEPIGVVLAPEALQRLLNEMETEDEMLHEYISGVGYR